MAQDASSLERYPPHTHTHPDPRLTHPHQGLPRDYLTLYDTWRRLPLPEPGVKPSRENPAAKEKSHTKIPRHQINCRWLFTFSHSPQETPWGSHIHSSACSASASAAWRERWGCPGRPGQERGCWLSPPPISSCQLAKNTQSPKVTPSFKVQVE